MKSLFTISALALLITLTGQSQTNGKWEKWQWLIGSWKGEGNGQPGKGEGYFTFSFDLDHNVIVRKNHTVINDGSNQNIHDDLMIVYPAPDGKTKKAIYFDNEGHIIDYLVSFSDGSIVFTSLKTDNMPIFRLIYTQLGDNAVNIKFEMSQDGVNFNTYLEGKSIK